MLSILTVAVLAAVALDVIALRRRVADLERYCTDCGSRPCQEQLPHEP